VLYPGRFRPCLQILDLAKRLSRHRDYLVQNLLSSLKTIGQERQESLSLVSLLKASLIFLSKVRSAVRCSTRVGSCLNRKY